MGTRLTIGEFYFLDFTNGKIPYEKLPIDFDHCPMVWKNFIKNSSLTTTPGSDPLFVQLRNGIHKENGFLVGWGKGRSLIRLVSVNDCNSYKQIGIGFVDEQDATAFILKWS
jgi:hypothetical protein